MCTCTLVRMPCTWHMPHHVHTHTTCHTHTQVSRKNLLAEAEFEVENAGQDVDDQAVAASGSDLRAAVAVANHVSTSSTQDNPVYMPISDGEALLVTVSPDGSEAFEAVALPSRDRER